MYCGQCGLRNPDNASACGMCRAPLPANAQPEQVPSAAADMARFSLGRVLRGLAGVSPLLLAVAVPIIVVRWCIARLSRARLLTPLLASVEPRFERTDLGQVREIDQRSLAAAQAWFTGQGFEHVIDTEDLAPAQSVYRRTLLHRAGGIYGSISMNRLTRRVHYCSLFAFSGNRYFSVDNADALAIAYPDAVLVQHVPGLKLDAMLARLKTALEDRSARGVCLDTARLMMALHQVGRYSMHLALSQGVLLAQKPAAQRSLRTCHFHPTDIAVRVCAACGKPLCEMCFTMHQEKAYCRACLPQTAGSGTSGDSPGLPAGVGFAGLGVRIVAGAMDLVLALVAGLAACAAVALPVRLLAPEVESVKPVALALAQLVAVLAGIWDLLVRPMRTGRSLGQAAWGLRIFDRNGGRADAVAFYVRFAYKLVAFLFVFPLLGYAAALFRKDRRTLHDRLAGTVVVTHRAGLKALAAWVILLPCLAGLGLAARPAVAYLFSMLTGGAKPEVALETVWERKLQSAGLFSRAAATLRGTTGIVTLDRSVMAIGMARGDTLWTCAGLKAPMVAGLSDDTAAPLLILDGDTASGWRVRRLGPANGAALWQRRLPEAVPAHTWDADSGLLTGVAGSTVYALGPDGAPLWKRSFGDTGVWVSAEINDGVLVTLSALDDGHEDTEGDRIGPVVRTCAYLDRADGRVVWEISGAVGPVKALGGGWEVFAGEDGRLAVVRLADRRQLWRSRDTLGHVAAVGRFGRAGKGLDSVVLYTARAAVGAADGTVRFAYPPGLRPVALTSEHLLLLPGWRPPSDSAGVDSAIVLLDRRTGAVRARVPRRGCVNATPVAEDSTALYVAAMVREGSAVHLSSVLLVVSKAGGRVREVPLGRNLAAARIGVLPRDKLLFMASFQSLGAYRLPE